MELFSEISRLALAKDEKAALRKYFTKNPTQEAIATTILSTCEDDEERVQYLKLLLEPEAVVAAAGNDNCHVSSAFPKGLYYQEPDMLLKTSGALWEFQTPAGFKEIFQNELFDHYRYWRNGQIDKTYIPLYFLLSGAGTGKSRTATELPRLAKKYAEDIDNADLKKALEKPFVFNISFENGTPLNLKEEKAPTQAIALRMLHQLLGKTTAWDTIMRKYIASPSDVLNLILIYHKISRQDMTIFLIVDGLQTALQGGKDSHNKSSFFNNCMTVLSGIARQRGGPFVIACCAATITTPYKREHGVLMQVFPSHPIIEMLINDMGGHGRALETLQDVLVHYKDLDVVNFTDLINDIRTKLQDRYSEWIVAGSQILIPVLRIILSHQVVDSTIPFPGTDGLKVDDVTQFGLIWFQKTIGLQGFLTCAYVWLWIMAHTSGDPILKNWRFTYYEEQQGKGDVTVPPGAQYWQHLEHYVAQIRVLKSMVYENGEVISMSKLHFGAYLNGDVKICNMPLILERAVKQTPTNSSALKNSMVQCENGQINVLEGKYCIINCCNAPAGDSFCGIRVDSNRSCFTEIHQCKLVKSDVNDNMFKNERQKAADKKDYFILFTTGRCTANLTWFSGVVDKDVWDIYFGLFSGRALRYAINSPPIANRATFSELTGINGIGKIRANIIIQKRPYNNLDDCYQKTNIPINLLQNLSF
ncbi:1473_t:CDS:2 [Funneliformis mosseae]|uniref:1473_t:CDS:1 n=1 Tax=Funneliformis mosseae TaxID=27381 RepID=A0A9N9DVE8_FUNMO|nr:1473_t:CDS:2 [Funneliformis mosseae]